MISAIDRDTLYHKHHLSHCQIDDILGEKRSKEFPETKAQHLDKLHAFLKVSELLTKSGIAFIPLKGPLLSQRLYNDPMYRVYTDLDLFICFDKIPPAIELLRENGFKTLRYSFPEDNCRRKLLSNHVSEIHLYNQEWEVLVELHWNLFNIRIITREVHRRLIRDNVKSYQYYGLNFSVLSEEFELLYLIIHAGFHGWGRLKWLLDIKVFIERNQIDELRFVRICKELNCWRQVSICNELLRKCFPDSEKLPYSGTVSGRHVRLAIKNIYAPDEKESVRRYISNFLVSWRVFPTIKYKISLIRQRLLATDLLAFKRIPCIPLIFYLLSPLWKLYRGFRP
jgi:hypothetical protein